MGERFGFRCEACAYEVTVSGGPDLGMAVATQTIACAKCKRLFDVVTSEDPGRLGRAVGTATVSAKPGTPGHAWNGGDHCPRCRGAMSVTAEVELWD